MGEARIESSQRENHEPASAERSAAQTVTPSPARSYYPPHGLSLAGASSPDDIPLTRDNLLFLQHAVGNRAVMQLLQRTGKLREPVDADNREAAGVTVPGHGAAGVSGARTLGFGLEIQRKCACGAGAGPQEKCADCRAGQQQLQRQAVGAADQSSLPPSVSKVMQSSGGETLPRSTREQMEGLLGADLGGTRVHTDSQAARTALDISAHAFTVGRDIYFGPGQYQPDTQQGQHLLAHELTHTVQQAGVQSALQQAGSLISQPGDELEREAEAVASRVGRAGPANASPEQTPAARPGPATAPLVQPSWYDPFVEGAQWVGGQVASGARAVAGEVRRIGGAALECFGAVGSSVSDILFGSVTGSTLGQDANSLENMMGVPEPQGDNVPGILDTIISVTRHPCMQMIPGYTLMASLIGQLSSVRDFLYGAWRVMQNPGLLLDAIHNALAGLISQIPGQARSLAQRAITFSDPPRQHLEGIWRHLEPKLIFLADNWWEVLKATGEDLLWPWPGVWKDLGEIWEHIKAGASAIWHLNFGGATDHFLAIWRGFNNIAGRLYGWFFIASVLVGAIIGAFFGGAGAIPGAAAGAAFAVEVGQFMLISVIAAETASIAKAGLDLVFKEQTEEEEEEDYEQIANSSLVLGITGAMYLIGAVAARFARAIINRVAGVVWRRPALRGRGTVARGDIIEIRVATAARVIGLLRRRTVTWLESVRRNFPVIDLLEGGTINITPRGGRRPPLYQINGGRLISVKSTILTGADALTAIQGWVDELANFTTVRNVSVVNPSGRTLMVATQTPLDNATAAAVRTYATGRGVTVEIFGNLPPNHPAVVFPDAIPAIMGEAGVVAADDANDAQQAPAGRATPQAE